MERIPEPELMDDPVQAAAYARADCSAAHDAFVSRFRHCFPAHKPRRVIDLGCGTADVTLRFARAYPEASITGIDAAAAMLALANLGVADSGFEERIRLVKSRLSDFSPSQRFDTVISNSTLHHLADSTELWQAVARCAAPGAAVFVMDLRRPVSRDDAAALVAAETTGEPEIFKRDLFASLLAAYETEEVRGQLSRTRMPLEVRAVGDRHLMIWGCLS